MAPPTSAPGAGEGAAPPNGGGPRPVPGAGLPLGALVFHCGRCGSTLLARLFEADPTNRVRVEPEALRAYLREHRRDFHEPEVGAGFRTLVLEHGRAPTASERRLVVKLNSTSTVLARAMPPLFPDVPLIYLLRDPTEVVASLLAWPPPFLEPERRPQIAAALGGCERAPAEFTQVEWLAWYVGRNLQLAWECRELFAEVIDYGDLSLRYLPLVNRISGSRFAPEDPAIAAILSRHAKYPEQAYSRAADAARVPAGLAELVAPLAGAAYARWRAELQLPPAATATRP